MNIKETLSLIAVNARIIKGQEQLIEEKRKEFEQSIEPSKHIILSHQAKNRELLNKVVKIKFVDLLKEIAKSWGCGIDKIRVSNKIGGDFLRNARERRSEENVILSALSRRNILNIYIVSLNGRKSLTISQKISKQLDHPQTDGKPLLDHICLTPDEASYTGDVVRFTMALDDLKSFIFEKPLSDLMFIDGAGQMQPKDGACSYSALMLKIAMEDDERDNESEKE